MIPHKVCDIHAFSVDIAQRFGGPDMAILIQFFIHTISIHKRLSRNQHDGHTWNYCSAKELAAIFPYWSQKDIRRRLDKLIELKVLISTCQNKSSWDRTQWYAFSNEDEWGISNIPYISRKREMDLPETGNGFAENGKSIPLSNTVFEPCIEQDIVKEALACPKKSEDLKDCINRWKLDDAQSERLIWLQKQEINSDEGTLAHWSRSYSLERLKEVFAYSKLNARDNVGGYMNRILKKESQVDNENCQTNKAVADRFKEKFQWNSLEILKRYAKIHMPNGYEEEIPYNMSNKDFFNKLKSIHQQYFSRTKDAD